MAAVVRICVRLAGIPLALELAAARAATMPVRTIAAHLDDCIGLLVGGPRTALPRQRTLRAALDWSHALLSERERILFRRLAVFAGGLTVEAAELVCADPLRGVPEQERYQLYGYEILDVLASLTAKSLIQQQAAVDSVRFQLLEPVRQYACTRPSRASGPAVAGAASATSRRPAGTSSAGALAWWTGGTAGWTGPWPPVAGRPHWSSNCAEPWPAPRHAAGVRSSSWTIWASTPRVAPSCSARSWKRNPSTPSWCYAPAYDPDSNPIEWLWRVFRPTVTHAHQRQTIDDLVADADVWITNRTPQQILQHIGSPCRVSPKRPEHLANAA